MLVSNDIHYKLMWASRHQKIIIILPLICVNAIAAKHLNGKVHVVAPV